MKVGVMFDLRVPQGDRISWARRHGFVLEACEEAERLGLDSVWFTEHHGFDDGYLPQPLVYAAAVAARTSRIRIGTAVLVAPFRHPRHIVEEASVVDLLSGGRLELGLGAGYRATEFAMFGADRRGRLDRTGEIAREVLRAFEDSSFTPQPVQKPPPLWLGFSGARGARLAGRLGAGLLSLDPRLLTPYREGWEEAGGVRSTPRTSGLLNAWPSTDPERDWPVVGRLHAEQWTSYLRHDAPSSATPHQVDADRARDAGLRSPTGILFSTPDEVAAGVRRQVEGLPVDTVMVWGGLPGATEEAVIAHLRVVAERLRPLLTETGPPALR